MKVILWISRIFVGVLFILSGFIKANDPLGFSYKLQEYYDVFGEYPIISIFDNPFFHSTALEFSMLICVLEIALGIALLVGAWPRLVAWTLLIMIVFFTFLTGFSAITGKVTDCGCFGDAVKLTPWESFYKDLILLVFIGIIFAFRKHIYPLFSKITYQALTLGAVVISLFFTIMAYHHLPVIDFRPYAEGNDICKLSEIPPDAQQPVYELTMIYKNQETDELKEMTMDEYNASKIWEDTTWVFHDRKDKLIEEGFSPKIKNFRITDMDGEDVTDSIKNYEGYHFLVVVYNLQKAKTQRFDQVTDLASSFENYLRSKNDYNRYSFIALTSSGDNDIEAFRHEHQAAFPFFNADETELKTIIRSNPGLLLMKDCEVVEKWHWRDLPSFNEIKEEYLNSN